MDGSGGYHPKWGNPITKEQTWYALTDRWILAQKLRISKIQLTEHMKLKKKEDQSVDTSVFLRRENKISMEGVAERKYGAETEGKATQRLPHLGIHTIYSYQTQTVLWMPTRACWQEPNIAVSGEALPIPDKSRRGCSQRSIGLSPESLMEELEKVPKERNGFSAP